MGLIGSTPGGLGRVGAIARRASVPEAGGIDTLVDRSWLLHWDGREGQQTLLDPLTINGSWSALENAESPTGYSATVATIEDLNLAFVVGENALLDRGTGPVAYQILGKATKSVTVAVPAGLSGTSGTIIPEDRPCTELICGGSLAATLPAYGANYRPRRRPASRGGGLNCQNDSADGSGAQGAGADLPAGMTRLYLATVAEVRTSWDETTTRSLFGLWANTPLRRSWFGIGKAAIGAGSTNDSRIHAASALESTWGNAEWRTPLVAGSVHVLETLIEGSTLTAWLDGVAMVTTQDPTTNISTYSSQPCSWSICGRPSISGSFNNTDACKEAAYILGTFASLDDYSADAELHAAWEAQFPGLVIL